MQDWVKKIERNRTLLFVLLYILAISCNSKKENTDKSVNTTINPKYEKVIDQNSAHKKDSITINVISKITYKDAVQKYGEPIEFEIFIIDGALSEFRIELYNIYSKDQYNKENIEIKEATWGYNDQNNITIWYEYKNQLWQPVDLFKWQKGSVF